MKPEEAALSRAPIVEAVLDIDCDYPPGFRLTCLQENAREAFGAEYPVFRPQLFREHEFEANPELPPRLAIRQDLNALHFLKEDERQLVQVRVQGYSFNRLDPYTSLDDYLPEIERTWRAFAKLTSPLRIRTIRLRYINRILLPMSGGKVVLDDYLNVAPQLPGGADLELTGFLIQHRAEEKGTGLQVHTVLTANAPEGQSLPVILDNTVAAAEHGSPDDRAWISDRIHALRDLKNRIFRNTLTEKCLSLFR